MISSEQFELQPFLYATAPSPGMGKGSQPGAVQGGLGAGGPGGPGLQLASHCALVCVPPLPA